MLYQLSYRRLFKLEQVILSTTFCQYYTQNKRLACETLLASGRSGPKTEEPSLMATNAAKEGSQPVHRLPVTPRTRGELE